MQLEANAIARRTTHEPQKESSNLCCADYDVVSENIFIETEDEYMDDLSWASDSTFNTIDFWQANHGGYPHYDIIERTSKEINESEKWTSWPQLRETVDPMQDPCGLWEYILYDTESSEICKYRLSISEENIKILTNSIRILKTYHYQEKQHKLLMQEILSLNILK